MGGLRSLPIKAIRPIKRTHVHVWRALMEGEYENRWGVVGNFGDPLARQRKYLPGEGASTRRIAYCQLPDLYTP